MTSAYFQCRTEHLFNLLSFLVYADGNREAIHSADLSIREEFFGIQDETVAFGSFQLQLKVTMTTIPVGSNTPIEVEGTTSINIIINQAPEDGTCRIDIERKGADDKIVSLLQ